MKRRPNRRSPDGSGRFRCRCGRSRCIRNSGSHRRCPRRSPGRAARRGHAPGRRAARSVCDFHLRGSSRRPVSAAGRWFSMPGTRFRGRPSRLSARTEWTERITGGIRPPYLQVLTSMLAEYPNITLMCGAHVVDAITEDAGNRNRVKGCGFTGAEPCRIFVPM